ncbi:MAG: DUF3887 domain-containing protein [Turicibacter sp.]
MKKILWVMVCVMLVGCGAQKLSEGFSEEELRVAAEAIIYDFNNNAYDEVVARGNENLQSQLSSQQLEKAWNMVGSDLGQYKELVNIVFVERDDIVSVVAVAKYENKKVQFTLSFDSEMKLAGVYIK